LALTSDAMTVVWSIARRLVQDLSYEILSMESYRKTWHIPRTVEHGWLPHLSRDAQSKDPWTSIRRGEAND